jgi:lactate dehydrogenase-like 2-hydroxyacid dehydrogenase
MKLLLIVVYHRFELWNAPPWFAERLRKDFPRVEIVHLTSLTPATRSLMNAKRLAFMKPDAYVINVGRGPLIDDAALIEALSERRIGGAGIDVFEQEPLPEDSPLWNLNNLLITPHTAALTEKLWQRHYDLFSQNLRRYVEGEPLLFVVGQAKRVLSPGLERVTLWRRQRERSAPALHATVFSAKFHGTSAYSHSTPG